MLIVNFIKVETSRIKLARLKDMSFLVFLVVENFGWFLTVYYCVYYIYLTTLNTNILSNYLFISVI